MKLFFIDGLKKGSECQLTPPGISIGRELDNDIILEQEGASRYHSKLAWNDPNWILKDLGTTNGTKLNGKKIEPNEDITLKEGDKILIGKQTMLFAEKFIEEEPQSVNFTPTPDPVSESSDIDHSIRTIPDMEASEKSKDDDSTTNDNEKSSSVINFFDLGKDELHADEENGEKVDFFSNQNSDEKSSGSKNKKHAGILFYAGVIGVAVILIGGFLIFEMSKDDSRNEKPKTVKKVQKGAPLYLRFEKQITTSLPKNNIFRFVMEINNGKITITRDDLQSGLKDTPVRTISEEQLKTLKEKLKESEFMTLEQGQSGLPQENEDKRFSLSVAYGNDFNSIDVVNASLPLPFDDAVRAIEDFSDNVLQVRTMSLTPAELREDGMNAFLEAKQLFNNHLAEHGNLYKAKRLLKIAIENLGSFQPEPPEYNIAYKMRDEAIRLLKEQIDAHHRNGRRFIRLKQYTEAREEYKLIMDKTSPSSKAYSISRGKVIQLDEIIRNTKRK